MRGFRYMPRRRNILGRLRRRNRFVRGRIFGIVSHCLFSVHGEGSPYNPEERLTPDAGRKKIRSYNERTELQLTWKL